MTVGGRSPPGLSGLSRTLPKGHSEPRARPDLIKPAGGRNLNDPDPCITRALRFLVLLSSDSE